MKENRIKDALESIAHQDISNDVNLWPRLAEKVDRKSVMQTFRTRPVFALFIVLVALGLISSVTYAIGKVTGYIPGVGLVDDSVPIRVLAAPVVMERDGVTVTIGQVVADVDRTFIAYAFDGIPFPGDSSPMCGFMPSLQLPDGSTLEILGGGAGGWGGETGVPIRFETTVYYPPIPAGIDAVTVTIPCILPEGIGPENWQIPLQLSPAPKDYATPALEIGATFAASNPIFVVSSTPTTDMRIFTPEPNDILPATPSPVLHGSGLYLEKVIELPDAYILVGNFTDAGDLPGALEINLDPHVDLPHMEDKLGNSVAFNVREDIQPESMQSGVRYWAYEIAKPVQGPLTVTLDQINIATFYTFDFNFDAGPNPQTGQRWDLNLPIRLGNYEYFMDSVEVIENGYLFKYHSGTDVPEGTAPLFNLIGYTPEQDSSTLNHGETVVEYSEKLIYSPSPPTGQLTVELTSMETVPLQGPWTLIWTPPGK